MAHPHHIVLSGTGTSGYLHPGLAIARQLVARMPGVQVTFVGSGRSAERHMVRGAGFHHVSIPSQPAPENALRAVRFVTDNVAGYWASRWLLRERNVSLVVGLGGYGSASTVRAAMARGIPTILLEQNVVPGRATRWLAPSATAVCAGYAETQSYFGAKVSVRVTGNPARPSFEDMYWNRAAAEGQSGKRDSAAVLPLFAGRDEAENRSRRLLILAGNGGSRSLNEHIPTALARVAKRVNLEGWHIIHQSGEGQLPSTIDRYRAAHVDALVLSCVDELATVMFDSDIVVCRGVGTTLAEVALAGVPAILVPNPRAAEGFQLANAEVFEESGAAKLIDEMEVGDSLEGALAAAIESLVASEQLRAEMRERMECMARPHAAEDVAKVVEQVLATQTGRLAA